MKTNSGKKGAGMPVVRNPQFNFKEGFCWNNVLNPNARLLKVKIKKPSVNDVGSMSLSSLADNIPNFYLICLLNSDLLFDYYREFINCTVNIQINDIKQMPIIVPSKKELDRLEQLFEKAVLVKKSELKGELSELDALARFKPIETEINEIVSQLYMI